MKDIHVADIGGTNSRFAIFKAEGEQLHFVEDIWLKTNDYNSFEEFVSHLNEINDSFALSRFSILVFAVPGPVIGNDPISMSKIDWPIDIVKYRASYPEASVHFINDFVAQAFGCITDIVREAMLIKDGVLHDHPDFAVVGAGTGLGHGVLVFNDNRYVALSSESGHTAFAFVTDAEMEYGRFLVSKTGHPYAISDQVVSGPGLSLLHEFLTGKKLLPHEVATDISVDSETSQWFARFYGRCCRNYCVSVLTSGGKLFVSGGLAAKNPFLIDNDIFRKEFINSPLKSTLLHDMPIYLNSNESIALWGAAMYGIYHS